MAGTQMVAPNNSMTQQLQPDSLPYLTQMMPQHLQQPMTSLILSTQQQNNNPYYTQMRWPNSPQNIAPKPIKKLTPTNQTPNKIDKQISQISPSPPQKIKKRRLTRKRNKPARSLKQPIKPIKSPINKTANATITKNNEINLNLTLTNDQKEQVLALIKSFKK
ncbi:hypothetical protein HA402_015848 [Bradysia odoriphaga]|nr:hypothetical protein HA402_015848 [Bradysia odoriphaga]